MALVGRLTIFSMLIFLSTLSIVQAHNSLLDSFQQACPYSNFCTVNSTTTPPLTSGHAHCCLDCFCDEKCGLFGDCCPDFMDDSPNPGSVVTLECRESVFETEFYLSDQYVSEALPSYRVIDFCPQDNQVERCKTTIGPVPDHDDMVVVSDRNTGTPYRNKYCAQCHNVTDIVAWDLTANGCNRIEEIQLLASEVGEYLHENCVITSIPGDGVPANGRTVDCRFLRSVCLPGDAAEEIVEGCNKGPVMPYGYERREVGVTQIYKNAFCFQCHVGEGLEPDCQRLDHHKARSTFSSSYSFLLKVLPTKTTSNIQLTGSDLCDVGLVFDNYARKCRRIYCPPLQVIFGDECISIANGVNLVELVLVFTPVDPTLGIVGNVRKLYDQQLTDKYIASISRQLGLESCKITTVTINVFVQRDNNRVAFLGVRMQFSLDNVCSMKRVRSIEEQPSPLTEHWLLGENRAPIKMNGKVSFFKIDYALFHSLYLNYLLADGPFHFPSGIVLHTFFFCPYYILDVTEYEQIAPIVGKGSLNISHTGVNITTPMVRGYYQLSETSIAVCMETHANALHNNGVTLLPHLAYSLVPIGIVNKLFI